MAEIAHSFGYVAFGLELPICRSVHSRRESHCPLVLQVYKNDFAWTWTNSGPGLSDIIGVAACALAWWAGMSSVGKCLVEEVSAVKLFSSSTACCRCHLRRQHYSGSECCLFNDNIFKDVPSICTGTKPPCNLHASQRRDFILPYWKMCHL